jgi:hypothetical protein
MTNQQLYSYCVNENYEKLKRCLADPYIDPTYRSNATIKTSIRLGYTEIFKILYDDLRIKNSVDNGELLNIAAESNNLEVVKLLIHKYKINTKLLTFTTFTNIINNQQAELLRVLVDDEYILNVLMRVNHENMNIIIKYVLINKFNLSNDEELKNFLNFV